MGEKDIVRQAPNVARMKMLGAKVVPATSGSKTLKDATNEAIRYWIQHPETFYLIGSVVGPAPHPDMVARLQAIISEEMKWQLKEKTGKENPDTIIEDMMTSLDSVQIKKVLVITDRRQAIRTACRLANANDIVLVAGKGHEKHQEINGKKFPFDDLEELKQSLNILKN